MSKADSALVRVFLIDGTFKTFLVKKSDTVHSFKDQIAKKLKVDPTATGQYGLYVLTDNRRVDAIIDNPFELHVRWGTQSGTTRKFLFKRLDDVTGEHKAEEDKTKRRPSLFIKRPPSKSVTNSLKKPLEPSAFASSTYLTPLGSTTNNSTTNTTTTDAHTATHSTTTQSSPSTPVNSSLDSPDFTVNNGADEPVVGSLPTKPSFSSIEVNIGSVHTSNEWPSSPLNGGTSSNPGSPKTPARRPGPSVSRPLPKTPAFSPVLSGLKRAPSVGMQDSGAANGGLARKSSASWSVPSNNNSMKPEAATPDPIISVQEAIKEVMHDEYTAKSERDEKCKKIIIGWINRYLSVRGMEVTNLTTDLQDGVYLINLLEEVSGKKLEFYVKKPDNMTKKIDNLNLFIKFLSHLGIRITGVSAMDIYSCNENIMMAILLLVIKNDHNLNKSTFARARLPSSGTALSVTASQNRKSLGVHRESRDGETSPASSPPSSLSSAAFSSNPRDSLPPLVQVPGSPTIRPIVSVVQAKPRAEDLPSFGNISTSPGSSGLPSFTTVSSSPKSSELPIAHTNGLPAFSHNAPDTSVVLPSFDGASSTRGPQYDDNSHPMRSLLIEDMDRKSKRMSSAVWLSDDIKQQLFLFHEDLPQHNNNDESKDSSSNDIFDGPFLLKDAEPIEPDLDWDDPDRFDPEKVLLDLGDEEPLFPKEEKEVPFVFDDVEILSLKALKAEVPNVVEALDISFELPNFNFGPTSSNFTHDKTANARSILRNDRASVFGLEQFSSMEDVLTNVADEFKITI